MQKETEKLKRRVKRLEAVVDAILRKLRLDSTVEEDLDEDWASAVLTKRRKYPWN